MITALDWAASWLGGIIAGMESGMITYKEVKDSPSGWEDIKMSFESDLTALIDGVRNKENKHGISKMLVGAADIIEKDEGWIYDETNVQPETPTLASLEPDTAVLGDEDITLVCTGTGFSASTVINFAGNDEPTTFVSDTEVSTGVKPSLGWGAVAVPVLVKNGIMESDPLEFTFTDVAARAAASRKTKGKTKDSDEDEEDEKD